MFSTVSNLLARATCGLLLGTEDDLSTDTFDAQQLIEDAGSVGIDAEVVGLNSSAGHGLLAKANSNLYEPEMVVENAELITVVYRKIRLTDVSFGAGGDYDNQTGQEIESAVVSDQQPENARVSEILGKTDEDNEVEVAEVPDEHRSVAIPDASSAYAYQQQAAADKDTIAEDVDGFKVPLPPPVNVSAKPNNSHTVERPLQAAKRFLKTRPLDTSTPFKKNVSLASFTGETSLNSSRVKRKLSNSFHKSSSGSSEEDDSHTVSNHSSMIGSSVHAISLKSRNLKSDEEDEISAEPSRRVTFNLSSVTSVTSGGSSSAVAKSRRDEYSKREIRLMYEGYQIYGNDWKAIHWAYLDSFHESRNPRKLYDKWRQHLSRYPDAKTYFRRKVKTRKPPQVVPK